MANAFVISAIFGTFGYVWVFGYIAAAWLCCALVAIVFGARTRARPLEVLSPVVLEPSLAEHDSLASS